MATWTTIADARLEPDKPARSIDALALRDNPVAIAENAPNAPKVDQYYLLITTSTTWTVPKTGQYWIDLIGGGSGGSGGSYSSGVGSVNGENGNAGETASVKMSLIEGATYTVTIGAGGNGANSGLSNAGTGGNTTFGSAIALGGAVSASVKAGRVDP